MCFSIGMFVEEREVFMFDYILYYEALAVASVAFIMARIVW